LGEKWPVNLACDSGFHVNRRVVLHAANQDIGQADLLPLRRKGCCGFFRPKNATASAGFELAILGTSMLTTRPLKPLI
jgi:hypothetical protein